MKITKGRLKKLIQEELDEFNLPGMQGGSRGVAGSYGSTGVTDTHGAGEYDMGTHAESIASAYGRGEDEETKAKIAEVLEAMIGEDLGLEQANSLISDMLYQLVDKEAHEEDAMDEAEKSPMRPRMPYHQTKTDKWDAPRTSGGRKDIKKMAAKKRRKQGKEDVEDQMDEEYQPTRKGDVFRRADGSAVVVTDAYYNMIYFDYYNKRGNLTPDQRMGSTSFTQWIEKEQFQKQSVNEQEKNNPWAICHTTVDKEKEPEKYERCVIKIKKKNKQ